MEEKSELSQNQEKVVPFSLQYQTNNYEKTTHYFINR